MWTPPEGAEERKAAADLVTEAGRLEERTCTDAARRAGAMICLADDMVIELRVREVEERRRISSRLQKIQIQEAKTSTHQSKSHHTMNKGLLLLLVVAVLSSAAAFTPSPTRPMHGSLNLWDPASEAGK